MCVIVVTLLLLLLCFPFVLPMLRLLPLSFAVVIYVWFIFSLLKPEDQATHTSQQCCHAAAHTYISITHWAPSEAASTMLTTGSQRKCWGSVHRRPQICCARHAVRGAVWFLLMLANSMEYSCHGVGDLGAFLWTLTDRTLISLDTTSPLSWGARHQNILLVAMQSSGKGRPKPMQDNTGEWIAGGADMPIVRNNVTINNATGQLIV